MTNCPADHLPQAESTILNPLADAAWDREVTSHRGATIFHTAAWARVLSDTYGHQPYYMRFSMRGETFALVPMMEVRSFVTRSRGVCLPFSDCCAPLMSTSFGTGVVINRLRQVARERSWSYFELRDDSILPENAVPSESYYGHALDMAVGSAALFENFSDSARRALRKAERSGLRASVEHSAAAMTEFYALHVRTRRKHGLPPQPRTFFSNIQKHIIDAGLGFIVLVAQGKRRIAAAVFFKLGLHGVYKFGASDERWQELRPNNLAITQGINHLTTLSVKTLDFGRTEKTNEGLRRFKLSFGAREREISYGKFAVSTDSWVETPRHRSTLHNRFFRTLPAPMNRLAGVLLYPHLD